MAERKFWLIQRGRLNKKGGPSLTGSKGVVDLDYMGSSEFEWGAIPRAYRRIMYHYEEYQLFDAGVDAVGNRRLMLFCKKQNYEKISQSIQEFIKAPYQLQEWSDLDNLIKVADITKPWTICHTRFWWCIDRGIYGDWMAFLEEDSERIYSAIKHDYENWWQVKSDEEKAKLYKEALMAR